MKKLLEKGDSYLIPESRSYISKLKHALSSEEEPDLPPLDLILMEKSCDYFASRDHKDSFLDPPTFYQKKKMLGTYSEASDKEIVLSFHPKDYWKEYQENVLQALDYYKRALNFSGPEIIVPRKIELAAKASCRNQEILLAYTTHIYQTEDFIERNYLKNESNINLTIPKPSLFRRLWNWIRGRKVPSPILPVESRLSPKQIQLRIWNKIRSGSVREITRSEFIESLQKTLSNKGTSIRQSSPMDALNIYERLIFFVSNQNSPLEYRKYRRERAEIYLNLAKDNKEYYKKAISEFADAIELPNFQNIPKELIPALIIENFTMELGMAQVYFSMKNYEDCLRILNRMQPKLINIDERSGFGKGFQMERKNLLSEYRNLKRVCLRKLYRFEEADEIPYE